MKKNKLEEQKERLKDIFIDLLATNISILQFQRTLTSKPEEKQGLKRLINKSAKAIGIVREIKHYELLVSLYNMYVNKKETYFISICGSICSKELQKWDKTEKGFKEFKKLEQQAIDDYDRKQEESKKQAEFIKKAREEGKKVEMIYKDGKIQPIIVEEKPN